MKKLDLTVKKLDLNDLDYETMTQDERDFWDAVNALEPTKKEEKK